MTDVSSWTWLNTFFQCSVSIRAMSPVSVVTEPSEVCMALGAGAPGIVAA